MNIFAPLWRFWLKHNDHLIPWSKRKTTILLLLAPAAFLFLGYSDLTLSQTPGWYSFFIPVAGIAFVLVGVWMATREIRVRLRLRRQRKKTRVTYSFKGE